MGNVSGKTATEEVYVLQYYFRHCYRCSRISIRGDRAVDAIANCRAYLLCSLPCFLDGGTLELSTATRLVPDILAKAATLTPREVERHEQICDIAT